MARHKDFGSTGVFRPEELEEISFTLVGQDFKCVPILPGGTLIRIIASTEDSETGVGAITSIFNEALDPADIDRFNEVIEGTEYVVSVDVLVEILQWLIEQYSQRPTKRPSSSEIGPETIGLTSEAGISSTPEDQA
jgi:hypothetical protein